MRLPLNLRLEAGGDLLIGLNDILTRTNEQVNRLTEGKINAVHNATTAAPTTGTYSQGDFIRNSTPSELGVALSKYVIIGWLNVASGTPGTFLQCRVLTGN